MDPVTEIFARHGIREPWVPLRATGMANRIYATEQVVLRVAVAGDEALADARTESVAAPAVHAAGIATPRMLAWDDTFFERPYSLWERVKGITLGGAFEDKTPPPEVWRGVGRELAKLHATVRDVPDPRGWLDTPAHVSPRTKLAKLIAAGRMDATSAESLEAMFTRDEPALASAPRCFLHNDVHPDNVMTTADGAFLALIDWGDAGFGDPAIELAWMPMHAVDFALQGYREVTPIDEAFLARVRWAQFGYNLDRMSGISSRPD